MTARSPPWSLHQLRAYDQLALISCFFPLNMKHLFLKRSQPAGEDEADVTDLTLINLSVALSHKFISYYCRYNLCVI